MCKQQIRFKKISHKDSSSSIVLDVYTRVPRIFLQNKQTNISQQQIECS